MELVQARLVTDDVAGLAAFYAGLVGAQVPLNEYYVEVPAGPMTVGFSKRRFTEYCEAACAGPARPPREVVLDFLVADVDAEYPRIAALGAGLVLPPTTQPWGSRSMVFNDPEGNLVNVFSRPGGQA
ncbi:MAG TPA: VOC family protein [Streptosporangiaceae bacterium]|nr:VOC family protein [Streptosporangiaceae bacterium]